MTRESLFDQSTRVRDARPADAPSIAAIADRAWRTTYAGLFGPSFIELALEKTYGERELTAAIEAAAASPDAHFLVAERDGALAGYLHFEREADRAELGRIYVDPALKGHGIGTGLMDELHRRLEPGAKYVALVHPGNSGALHFYARYGAQEVGRIDGRRHFLARYGLAPADEPADERDDVLLEITVGGPA